MIIVLKETRADHVAEAHALLVAHQPERSGGGLCRGCSVFANHILWWPCPQAKWARSVLDSCEEGESQ